VPFLPYVVNNGVKDYLIVIGKDEIMDIGICILVAIIIVVIVGVLFLISVRLRDISEALDTQNRLILILLKQKNVPNVPDDLSKLDDDDIK
jgi:hypothetical protein